MPRIVIGVAVAVLVVAIAIVIMALIKTTPPPPPERKALVKETQKTDRLESKISELNHQLSLAQDERDGFMAKVTTLEQELELVRDQLNASRSRKPEKEQNCRPEMIQVPGGSLFLPGKTTLNDQGRQSVKELAEILKTKEGVMFQIEGHTDNTGLSKENRDKYGDNMGLSVLRALTVGRELITQGVPPELISVAGFGEYQPLVSNATPEGQASNRRVMVRVFSPTGPE